MFSQTYIQFFQDLSANNNAEWFNLHKKTYENEVKKPFEAFIGTISKDMHRITPEIEIDPKASIFRINKDTRFSADKSPYKIEMSAVISPAGKKGNPCPGLYLSLGAEKVVIASGLKMLDKLQLAKVRHHLAHNLERINTIISHPEFKEAFGEVQGEKVKRIPDEFKEAAKKQTLLYHTTFLAIAELPAQEIIHENFVDRVINLYERTLPFASFF